MDPVLRLLTETPLFGGLPAEDLRQVAALARRQRARAGQVMVQAGGPARMCWIVSSGTVELGHGGDAVLLGRGRTFDEGALVRDTPSAATVTARDEVEVVTLPGEAVRRIVPRDTLASRLLRLALEMTGPADEPGPAHAGHDVREVSRAMQRAMLPRNAPRVPGYDIAAGTTVEDEGQGSSVWDAATLPDGRWALAVFDVRTEGQPPALLLGMARTAWRTALDADGDLPGILARMNRGLAPVLGQGQQFVECALVVPDEGGVEWAAAGRLPAGVLGRAGTLDALGSQGPPLGMLEGFRYGSQRAAMGVGDALLVLSSGSAGLFRGAADLVVQVQERTAGEVVATVHRGIRATQTEASTEVSVLFLRKH